MSSETDEEKRKRWAANAAKACLTPQMLHAMNMSKFQSQNKYKATFEKTKAKGYTPVASTPEMERVKLQSQQLSSTRYKKQFEEGKSKFTSVADTPEMLRLKKTTELSSQLHYKGKPALAQSKRRRDPKRNEIPKESPVVPEAEEIPKNVPEVDENNKYGREISEEEYAVEEPPAEDNDHTMNESMHGRETSEEEYNSASYGTENGDSAVPEEQTYKDEHMEEGYLQSQDFDEVEEYNQKQVEEENVYDEAAGNSVGYQNPEQPHEDAEESIYDLPEENEQMNTDNRSNENYGEEDNLDNFYAALN